ncbi:SNF2 domain-containing protein CLASSY 3-like [Typha latifolia]|uniref:SNF2 domain-containing protein CLASSY 3-like n=1 Tax=Typha latifolia TaxID=4733 RepID=UPI003C2E3896
MDSVTRRKRVRETLSGRIEPDARQRDRGGGEARVLPGRSGTAFRRPELVVIVDDEEEEDDRRGRRDRGKGCSSKGDNAAVAMRTRSRSLEVLKAEELSSSLSSDQKGAVFHSGYGGGDSEGTVEGSIKSKSGSNEGNSVSLGTSDSVAREFRAQESNKLSPERETVNVKKELMEEEQLEDSKNWIDDGMEESPESEDADDSEGEGEGKEEEEIDGDDSERDLQKVINLMASSSIAQRTRSRVGIQKRFSYTPFFEELSNDTVDKEEEHEEEEEDNLEINNSNTTIRDDQEGFVNKGESSRIFRKRKFSGIDILVPLGNDKANGEGPASSGSTGVAKRTRSCFSSEPEKKKQKLGTVSNPYCLDVDESDSVLEFRLSSSGEEDEKSNKRNQVEKSGDINVNVMDIDEGKGGLRHERVQPWKDKKIKRCKMPKGQDLAKLLVDTIWNDKEKLSEDSVPIENSSSPLDENQCCDQDFTPLQFSFGDEDPEPVERSDYEKATDELWADFEFALESMNIGTYNIDEGQEKQSNKHQVASDPRALCSQGKHEFILDEQIGIKCKFCSFVSLEIRHVLPSLSRNIGQKSALKHTTNLESPLLYDDLGAAENNDKLGSQCHPEGTVWDLIPGMIETMYPHQQEAFEFMWKNLAGGISLNELKNGTRPDVVGGCVISHAPGTGKTRLAIVFIQTYMKIFPECRPVIIAPSGMLLTWEEEFKKWNINLPFHMLNSRDYSGREDNAICKLVSREPQTEKLVRLVKLYSWEKGGGILGISYGLFKGLTSDRCKSPTDMKLKSILLEKPGLLVLDEGHTPRNERSLIWKALGKVKTEQRVILSGTPFQNNFLELYNILCLVRPKFAEKILINVPGVSRRKTKPNSEKEQTIYPEKDEGKGFWTSLTSQVTDHNVAEVRSVLKPFVHIHNGNILQALPGLRECVIILNPLPLQKDIIEKMEKSIGARGNFETEYQIAMASVHPYLVTSINMTEEEAALINKNLLEDLRLDPFEGVKTRFVIEVVRLCEALKEKVLIFSQYIQPLTLIKEHLIMVFNWSEGKEVLQMDGKILPRYRQSSIDVFNDLKSEAKVLLASTKACCEGISLTGASRVVLLDVVWNPAVGRQAISRAYRIGQEKIVYTYNLITSGTKEGDKYDRQSRKDHLSKLVFSPEYELNNVKNSLSQAAEEHSLKLISEDKILEEMTAHDQLKDMFVKIYYPPTESNMFYTYRRIASEFGG